MLARNVGCNHQDGHRGGSRTHGAIQEAGATRRPSQGEEALGQEAKRDSEGGSEGEVEKSTQKREGENMNGEMSVLGREGDTKIIWDSENLDEVEHARKSFDELTKKGFSAFSVKRDGEKGGRLAKFDAEEEKMILTPALRGG